MLRLGKTAFAMSLVLGCVVCGFVVTCQAQESLPKDGSASKASVAGEAELGARIFKQQCAECHGTQGQGGSGYSSALEGGLSLVQLTKVIQETMPEEDPGSLSEKDAAAVGRFVYDSFYSSIAQARNRPARIELARLTVNQYRQSITDLVGSFGWSPELDGKRGLKARYVEGRKLWDKKAQRIERTDPQIDFDFGQRPPIESFDEKQPFTVMWSGSLFAPETGKYKIAVYTPDAVRVWVNGKPPIINAFVKSKNEVESVAEIYLVAGRYYPIAIEYARATQGVTRLAKNDTGAGGRISLKWTRPHGVMEAISERYFVPVQVADSYICDVPFPPDDRSYGWVRSTSISKEWDRATTLGALHAADYVSRNIDRLAKTKPDDPKRVEQIKKFCEAFVEKAFRKKVDEPYRNFISSQFDDVADPQSVDDAVRRVALFALKSPQFLYREVSPETSPHDVASRLSYTLWDSIPDRRLTQAAEENRLQSAAQVRAEAARMLSDERATQKLMDFFRTWLQIDAEHDLNKDDERYPEFDAATMAQLRESLELGLHELVTSESADYRDLIRGDEIYVNERLAQLFGLKEKPTGWFESITFEPEIRAGILTHPYLLAQFAYSSESSPIHRGVFIARNVLGKRLKPPPVAVAPIPPDLNADLTTRERVALQTKPAECMSCHQIINPLGFTLENFDAVGRFRDNDKNKKVDSAVEFDFGDSQTIKILNANDLADRILKNEEAQAAFCERLFQYLVGQPVLAYGPNVKNELRSYFVENDFNIRKLAEKIAVLAAMKSRQPSKKELAK